MPELQGMVLKAIDPDKFENYLAAEVAPKMRVWRPRGIVLHNTGTNPHWTENITSLQAIQLVKNMSVTWVAAHFKGGPHLVIGPDGMIILAWPLWKPGTHSPSWNSTFWGLEMVGDFDKEPFNPIQEHSVSMASACLYAMLGHEPNNDTFHLHKEDPRTSHKRCPGVNCGDKITWLKRIDDAMHSLNPHA